MRGLRAALVFLVPFATYLAIGDTSGSGDSLPARYLPLSLLREADFDLDEFAALFGAPSPPGRPAPYALRLVDGHYVSAFSPGPAVLALPVYAVPVLAGVAAESAWPARLEKLSAAAITALSVLVFFLAARRTSSDTIALVAAAVYAFGTSSLSVSSQALWEHGPAQLFLAVALWARGREHERGRAVAGAALALAVVMRPPTLLAAAPLAVEVLGRRPARVLAWMGAPLALLAIYNTVHFGAPWSSGRDAILAGVWWSADPLGGLAGLLFSPGRGLFVYSPVLVLAAAGLAAGAVRRRPPFPALALGVALVVAACSFRRVWWGGSCYGPRLLADVLPLLCFGLLPVLEAARRRPWLKAAVAALALASTGVHALGAAYDDRSWDDATPQDRYHERLWSWQDGPIPYFAERAAGSARRVHAVVRLRLWRLPASGEPRGLAATYPLAEVPATVAAGQPFPIRVRAFNTGRAVWLHRGEGGRGMVRLAWSWSCDGRELPAHAGRGDLPFPVFPGESFEFRAAAAAPDAPGDCVLAVGLVSELVEWFSALGTRPLLFPIHVTPRPPAAVRSGG